jgi:predicted neuraminidase
LGEPYLYDIFIYCSAIRLLGSSPSLLQFCQHLKKNSSQKNTYKCDSYELRRSNEMIQQNLTTHFECKINVDIHISNKGSIAMISKRQLVAWLPD